MKLDIVSLIFFIIIFVSVMSGLKKGFFKILVNIIRGILSFALAILLAKPIADLLSTTPIGETLCSKLNSAFLNQGGVFSITITESNKAEVLKQALSEINIPEFLSNVLSNFITNLVEVNGSVSVAEALSNSLTYYILIAIAFIVVFVIAPNILFAVPINGSFSIFLNMPFSNEFSTWFSETIMLNDPETFTLAKYFYENNFVLKIIAYIQSLMA